jgi:predicted nucleic acid-binding Zn finger protein
MKIKKERESVYKVESESKKGKFYTVQLDQPFCDCPQFMFRGIKKHAPCKHIKAVQEFAGKNKEEDTDFKEIINYVKQHLEVDSVELIEKFGEEKVNGLIERGELIEEKGKIRILS